MHFTITKLHRKTLCQSYYHSIFFDYKFLIPLKSFIHFEKNAIIEKNNVSSLKFDEKANVQVETLKKNYQIDDSYCSYITKKRKFLNLISYEIKKYDENIFYKKNDGSDNAFLYSNKLKPLPYCDRISNSLFVNCLSYNNKINTKKSLFDILYKKHSLVFFFNDFKHINEMNNYLENLEKNKNMYNIEHKINHEYFLKLKKRGIEIHLIYCYISPYKFLLSNYFSKKISESLKSNYFNNKHFVFINSKLNINDQNALLLLDNAVLPSLLLFDSQCYVRYHVKGLYTNEAAHYLFKVLMHI